MLAYNVVLCCADLSSVTLLYGYLQMSFFACMHSALPELTYD